MSRSKLWIFILICFLAFIGNGITEAADQSSGRVSMVVPRNWNTFIGGAQGDGVSGVITDSNGNIYVGGYSAGTWGNPIRAFTTNSQDGFIAKFNPRGELLWNTFIGENAINLVSGLYINNSGTIYVVGSSNGSWGAPVTANAGGADAFIARFNADGALLWNTFMGGTGTEGGSDITVDSSGAMVITGSSNASWGSPVRPFTPSTSDAFAAKLNAVGTVLWHTFLGGPHIDSGYGVTVDGNGNVFVGGRSVDNWGAPLNPQAGNGAWDAFAARLDSNGNLVWNTFIGEPHYMYGCIGDRSGNIYMTGQCYATFGNPIRPYLNGDIHVVKINPNGGLAWNTFLGSSATGDQGHGLALDRSGNVYVSARVEATWGMPRQPYTGGRDCMVAKLSTTGHLQWHTFMGSATDDEYPKVAVSPNGSVYVAGQSDATWGAPIRLFDASTDVFLASFDQYPEVSGYVLDPDGHPVGGVEIFFSGDRDPEITNPAGRFSKTTDFGWAGTIAPERRLYL